LFVKRIFLVLPDLAANVGKYSNFTEFG
jgi:hypothetical protein